METHHGDQSLRIGAHVDQDDPLAHAASRSADVVQFFLGDPQGWKGPVIPDSADALRDSLTVRTVSYSCHDIADDGDGFKFRQGRHRLRGRFALRYCGGGDLGRCASSLWAALKAGVDELALQQGPDPSAWRVARAPSCASLLGLRRPSPLSPRGHRP